MKLYVYPVLLYAVVEALVFHDLRRLVFAKLVQVLTGMLFILTSFYTYTGALGIENVVVDIVTFVVAMALGYWISLRLLLSPRQAPLPGWASAVAIATIIILFCVATFAPPHLPLFLDRNTSRYGIG